MKFSLAAIALMGMFASAANAATLECRLLGINDSPKDVKPIRVQTSSAEKTIGKLGGDQVVISEINGYFQIRISGSNVISAGSKSAEIFLSIEGSSVECAAVH